MIETRQTGNIFDCGAHAIVNTVNCVGVMGKGIALEYKNRYPAMFTEYAKLCKRSYIKPGKMWVWHEVPFCKCGHELEIHDDRVYDDPEEYGCVCGCMKFTPVNEYIINFPTKQDWRNPSQLEWIAAGLDDLKTYVTMDLPIRSLAMPALGCANGKLSFKDVLSLIQTKLGDLTIPVIVFEPQNVDRNKLMKRFNTPVLR